MHRNFRIKGDVLQELLGETGSVYLLETECKNRPCAREAASYMYEKLRGRAEILSIRSSAAAGEPEIRVRVNRERLASLGLSPGSVGELIRNAVEGSVPTHFREGDLEIPVRVRLREEDRRDASQLHSLYMQTGENSRTQLGTLINTSEAAGYASVLRENQRRLERIRIEYKPENEKELRDAINILIEETGARYASLPAEDRPTLRLTRENAETMESLKSLVFAFGLSMILIYLLLAAQFESVLHPLTLALSIPLMMFGVSFSLLITGHGLNITSAIGMIMLVGIVANAAVILYEYIQHYRTNDPEEDLRTLQEILRKSVRDRIRPILLTTLTTILGLIPMALPSGSGGDLQAPMAVAVMGGLTVSTILTMVAFPSVFHVMESMRLRRRLNTIRIHSPGGVPAA